MFQISDRRPPARRAAAILAPMRLTVSVQEDHLASLVRSPIDGLTELIWNSLDADADDVEVVYERNTLGGIDALKLTARFALHLLKYPTVSVRVDRHTLDPKAFVDSMTDVPMETEGASLTVIEWKRGSIKDRSLYLCDTEGVALHQVSAGVHPTGINYSAYLKSELIRQMEGRLILAEFDQDELAPLIEEAREAVRQHFEQRAAERARDVIQNWQNEQVYPFPEPPRDEIETIKRQLFDVVAYTASSAVNSTKDPRSKRLRLRLLEQALENEPAELRRILEEVLKLPKEQVEQLDELLQHTALTSIVTAASRIANRLKFLAGLQYLLFDPEMKQAVKERSQLHKIVAAEPWVFGEEFALAVNDRSLNEVLAQHRKELGEEVVIDDGPVTDADGKAPHRRPHVRRLDASGEEAPRAPRRRAKAAESQDRLRRAHSDIEVRIGRQWRRAVQHQGRRLGLLGGV